MITLLKAAGAAGRPPANYEAPLEYFHADHAEMTKMIKAYGAPIDDEDAKAIAA